jgi:hypothetical protein
VSVSIDPHETRHPSGIVVPDPDQGTPYIHVQFSMPSTALMVWERFDDDTPGGHNLLGFTRRWAAWTAGDEPFLQAIDPRFGGPLFIPRAAIQHAVAFWVAYHRKEDVRAGVRGLAVPGEPAWPTARRRPDGSIEVRVPR